MRPVTSITLNPNINQNKNSEALRRSEPTTETTQPNLEPQSVNGLKITEPLLSCKS